MKMLRVALCATLLLSLTGCSTLSSVSWSSMAPWNWFGSSTEISVKGVGELNGSTPFNESAIAGALNSDYRIRSGMKTENGDIVRYFEALKEGKLALVIHGDSTVSRIEVLANAFVTGKDGATVGTPFSSLYSKAYGNCDSVRVDGNSVVNCNAPGSRHISYQFSGNWNGPEGLIPPDEVLKNRKVERIVWQR